MVRVLVGVVDRLKKVSSNAVRMRYEVKAVM